MLNRIIYVLIAVVAGANLLAEPMLKDGDKLAIAGDSITEHKRYTNVMETYITVSSGLKNVQVMQFGKGWERTPDYVRRMKLCHDFFPATVETTLYGMNDGRYRAYDPKIGEEYYTNSVKIARFLHENHVKLLAGSPGAVDTDTFKRCPPDVYNNNLDELRKLGEKAAAENGARFVNIHQLMIDTMAAAKKHYGPDYHVCGLDGLHPFDNGHLIIAYAFLKGLGLDGDIGRIEMDYGTGKATGSEGHRILSCETGSVQVESSRYPYVFTPGSKPNQNASILPFLPFNKDLNRFMLTVKNLSTESAVVHFGNGKKTFTRTQLKKGINLAGEFIEDIPFRENFNHVSAAIRNKQNFETWIGQVFLFIPDHLPSFRNDPEVARALNVLNGSVKKQWLEYEKQIQEKFKAVTYTIKVIPIN